MYNASKIKLSHFREAEEDDRRIREDTPEGYCNTPDPRIVIADRCLCRVCNDCLTENICDMHGIRKRRMPYIMDHDECFKCKRCSKSWFSSSVCIKQTCFLCETIVNHGAIEIYEGKYYCRSSKRCVENKTNATHCNLKPAKG